MPPDQPFSSHPANTPSPPFDAEYTVDLRELFMRLGRGLGQILGLGMLGLVIASLGYLIANPRQPVSTSTRVVFSFPGFEKGAYPDQSKFQPDDLRTPDIIAEALKRQGLDTSSSFQSTIRGNLSIEGIIPSEIIKDRDRLRAAGQNPPPYFPDEYTVTLTLPHNFPLSSQQRGMLINEIVNVYREHFWHTYADLPPSFGSAFAILKGADFPDYELILNEDVQNIITFLNQKLEETATQSSTGRETLNKTSSKMFRSPTTNLSFSDLLRQTRLFAQIRLNETLGLIYLNGLSRDRAAVMAKMEYQLQTLDDQTNKAVEQQKMVHDLLTDAQKHAQGYVLGIKSQAGQPQSETPIIDQGLIDSLVANDAYNFLVHQALDAGFKVTELQAERETLLERKKHMESFLQGKPTDQSALMAQAQKSLDELEPAYQQLVDNIRKTNRDFASQQFGDAVRLSAPIATAGIIKPLVVAGAVGCFLGLAAGLGLSFLGIYIGGFKKQA